MGYYPRRGTALGNMYTDASGGGNNLSLGTIAGVAPSLITASHVVGQNSFTVACSRGVGLHDRSGAQTVSGFCLVRRGPFKTSSGHFVYCFNSDRQVTQPLHYGLGIDFNVGSGGIRYGHRDTAMVAYVTPATGRVCADWCRPHVIGFSRASNGKDVSLYLDGELVNASSASSASDNTKTSDFNVSGVENAGGTDFTCDAGSLEDVAVFSNELSAYAHRAAYRYLIRRRR